MCYGTNEAQAHNNACLVESIGRDKSITKFYQVYQINSEETFRLNKEETRLWVGAQLAGYRRKLKQANELSCLSWMFLCQKLCSVQKLEMVKICFLVTFE